MKLMVTSTRGRHWQSILYTDLSSCFVFVEKESFLVTRVELLVVNLPCKFSLSTPSVAALKVMQVFYYSFTLRSTQNMIFQSCILLGKKWLKLWKAQAWKKKRFYFSVTNQPWSSCQNLPYIGYWNCPRIVNKISKTGLKSLLVFAVMCPQYILQQMSLLEQILSNQDNNKPLICGNSFC